MADVTNLNIKIDRDLKTEADKLFNEMGMNITTVSAGQRRAAMQEIRDLLANVDGSNIDLDQMKAERRAVRFERNA